MAKKYRIAVIGFAHMHISDQLKAFATCGDRVEFVAAADLAPEIPTKSEENGTRKGEFKKAVSTYGFRRYDDYELLLDENQIDIALVCTENASRAAVCELLLRKGIHVVMEKPLSATMRGALRIVRASRETGATVLTNWPTAWQAGVRTAKRLVESGEIGRLFKFSYRNSDSQGPLSYGQKITDAEKGREWWYRAKAGGGSMLDYCCYGACMSGWFLGEKPVSAYGVKANFASQYGDAEDYASITVRFPNAVAQLEGSWSTVNGGVPAGPLLYGTEGTIVVRNQTVEVYKTRHVEKPDKTLEFDPLPTGRENLGLETLHHLETGDALFPMLDLPLNLAAVSILDAGARSAVSGKMEPANDAVWEIGTDPYER
jgi:predicted dehydrogenase